MSVPGKRASNGVCPTLSTSSGEDFELFCMPCDTDDLRVPAVGYCLDCEEHLCASCFDTHKRPKPLRHHKLLDKDCMPKTQSFLSNMAEGQSETSFTKLCSKHSQENIKFYCHDHTALLCSVCVTLNHPATLCQVAYIPDISEQILDSKEYTDILKDADAIGEKCQARAAKLKKMTNESNSSLTEVVKRIKKFRHEINEKLDKLENLAEAKADSIKQENDEQLKKAEKTCEDMTDFLKRSSNNIRHLNTSKQADKLFVEINFLKQLIKEKEECLRQLTLHGTMEYTFTPNEEILLFLARQRLLGTVMMKMEDASPKIALKSWQSSKHTTMSVKTPKDENKCWITGMILLNPKTLVVADYQHNSIKMVDIKHQIVTNHTNLGSSPWDITIVKKGKTAAVTLPDKESIQFISFFEMKGREKTLKTDGKCRGICSYQEKLAVTTISPAKLQVIDLNGKILSSFEKYSSGKNIFSVPEYVTANSRSIFVSDKGVHAVIMLNWQGEVTGSFGGLGSPKGLASLEDGSIFASDAHLNKCSIQHISRDCTKGKTLLKDLASPIALCWCSTNSTLYFSCGSWSENDNSVQIVKLS